MTIRAPQPGFIPLRDPRSQTVREPLGYYRGEPIYDRERYMELLNDLAMVSAEYIWKRKQ